MAAVKGGQTVRGDGFVKTPLGNAYSIVLNPFPRVIAAPGAAKQIGAQVVRAGSAAAASPPGARNPTEERVGENCIAFCKTLPATLPGAVPLCCCLSLSTATEDNSVPGHGPNHAAHRRAATVGSRRYRPDLARARSLIFADVCDKSTPPRTHTHPPTQAELGAKAFVITDPGVTAVGITGTITGYLKEAGVSYGVYDRVDPNPTFANVRAGIQGLLSHGLDGTVVVSLGGGSSMDCAKAVSVIASNRGGPGVDVAAFCRNPVLDPATGQIDPASAVPSRLPKRDGLPIICVPTTSGTASECNGGAVITDSDAATPRKLVFSHGSAAAKLTLLDPVLTLKLPAYPTATCGMDALTHALEAFTSRRQNPFSDAVAYGVIRTVAEWLPRLVDDLADLEARSQIQLASHMAGQAFGVAGLGICHAVGHPLSAMLHQAHGQTLATMLPHIMQFNLPARADKYARVAECFGVREPGLSDEENARRAIKAVAELSIRVGTAKSITDLGGGADIIPELAQQAMSDTSMMATPLQPTMHEVKELYRLALTNPVLYPAAPKTLVAAKL